MNSSVRSSQYGISMIEVLITIVIVALGLLGLAGLQGRLQAAEMEAYQRSQALILLDDMANRITSNRYEAINYVTSDDGVGTGMPTCINNAAYPRRYQDLCEWSNTLLGAGEKKGSTNVGSMIGARGCVEAISTNQYMVTVAWQGIGPLSTLPGSVKCGKDHYDGSDASGCTNDKCRRAITTVIRVAGMGL